MEDIILNTIKNMLGIDQDSKVFDGEIIVHINSSFMDLYQLIELKDVKMISSGNETWNEIFEGIELACPSIPKFVYLKVKLGFDPPSSSFVIEELKRQLQEEEWRLSIQLELLNKEGGENCGNKDQESE